jgi:alkaline phosphatase
MIRSRKFFLANLFVAVLVLHCGAHSFAGEARNVILMIGDGMGPAHVGIASLYATRQLGKNLVMTEIMDKGRTAYLVNDTADATVTESAAAATQMATGVKVTARAIGMGPDGRVLKTILEIAKEKGKATGLVTTSGITDATPAGFVAHVAHRSAEDEIADQLVKSGVNILFGGRKAFFLPESEKGGRKDGRNLLAEARRQGYAVAATGEEMKAAEGQKILGLFNSGNMRFEIDRRGSGEPSLAEMTGKALEILRQNRNGFFLMVEAGRIDHASHYHDIGALISDMLAFDEAVHVAYEFQKARPDTLLIITADHETGGVAVIPHSPTSKEYQGIDLPAISKVKASVEVWAKELGKDPSPEKVKEVFRKYFEIDLNDEEVRMIREHSLKKLDSRHFRSSHGFALRLHHRIGWSTDTHTGTPLFLWGIGPGSERIKGWRHNTDLFSIMKDAYGF